MNRETEASAWEKIEMQQLRRPRKERRRGAERAQGVKVPQSLYRTSCHHPSLQASHGPSALFCEGNK
jgi:hypothetical protein